MAIVQRNSGTFTSTTSITVSPASGTFGTGTVLVVAFSGNTTINTPGGWTLRASNVSNLGLYAFDKAGAGESSLAFTAGAAGSGEWFVWELSAGSTFDVGQAAQTNSAAGTYATPSITPTSGSRHLLATGGGSTTSASPFAVTVTAWTSGFVEFADAQVQVSDWPFSAAADVDVTANGSTAYSTTVTYSTAPTRRGAMTLAYLNAVGDTTAPSVPTGLATTAVGSTTADLSWNAATDDVGVTGYEILVTGP